MGELLTLALFTGGLGWQEILLIMVVLLVFFGNRIPEVMRSLGRGMSQFKKGLREMEDEVKGATDAVDFNAALDTAPETAKEVDVEAEKVEDHVAAGPREEERETEEKELAGPHPDAEAAAKEPSEDDAAADAGEAEGSGPDRETGELAG